MYRSSQRAINMTDSSRQQSLSIKVVLTSGGAKAPTRVKNFPYTQSLTLIKRKGVEEDEVGKVTTFEVGLYFISPPNVLLQMVASPSLIAHGYMLSSGVMTVPNKQSFTIQLYKFREGPDLQLPYEGIYITSLQAPSVFYQRTLPPKKPTSNSFSGITNELDSSLPDFESHDINHLS